MSYTSNTLKKIIQQSFDDKQSSLVKSTGLPKSSVSRILAGSLNLTPDNLTTICAKISPEEARSLCLATCRDLVPEEIAPDLTFNTPTASLNESATQYGLLHPETEEIFRKLRVLCARDKEMHDWITTTAKWIFPKKTITQDHQAAVRAAKTVSAQDHQETHPPKKHA